MTIVEFLEARLAEDEKLARDAHQGLWKCGYEEVGFDYVDVVIESGDTEIARLPCPGSKNVNAWHIARHDPARVLRECEAKRSMFEIYGALSKKWPDNDYFMWRTMLGHLASVYSDHPDYQSEWG